MSVFDCDPSWPLCLYDFTHKNLTPKYVAFRVQAPLTSFIVSDDYYYSSDPDLTARQLPQVQLGLEEEGSAQPLAFEDLLI